MPGHSATGIHPDEPSGALALRLRAMLGAIGYAAAEILGGGDRQAGIREFLARLGAASGVGRVTLFEVFHATDGRLAERCVYDWAAPGLAGISGDPRYREIPLQDRPGGDLEDWSRRRQRGEVVQARRCDTTGYTREIFEQHGTLSFISVPILIDGDWWGFIGFDDCEVERSWTEIEVDLLKAAAALIAGAIRRGRMEERLRLSEERYALAARGASDGLFDWNIASDTVYLAPRVGEILGRDGGVPGARIDDLFALLDAADGASPAEVLQRQFAAHRRKVELECRVRPAPGAESAERWVMLRGLILYAGDRPSRVVGSLRDISRRKQAEAEVKRREQSLDRSRRLLRSVIDAVPAVINVKDRESRYLLMNRFQGEVYGVAPEDAIGRTSADLRGAGYGGEMRLRDLAVMESGEPQRFIEHDFVDAAGRARNWFTQKVPLLGDSGGIEGVVTVALDVTELKALERARANLARYVAPGMVDLLAATDEPFGSARQQAVAVMFVDIVGFTPIAAEQPPEQTFALLRGFLARAAGAVFANDGTLDKYTGDGMMATFGTPNQGARDASNALACARALQRSIRDWNRERIDTGDVPIEVAVGLHYGPVLLGNIGDARRLEFAVIGDTVNVANRLESLARPLAASIVASGDLVDRARREGGAETAAILEGLEPRDPQPIRGRSRPVPVWVLPRQPVVARTAP